MTYLDMFQEGLEVCLVCGKQRRCRREELQDERAKVWIIWAVLA